MFVTFAVFLAGCGESAPFEYRKTSGSIVYEDGQPISPDGFELYFVPQVESSDGQIFPRTAIAHVDGSGKFSEVTSYKYGDGLIPAKHKVFLKIGPGADKKPRVPKEYLSIEGTPLIVDPAESDFLDIKVPRP